MQGGDRLNENEVYRLLEQAAERVAVAAAQYQQRNTRHWSHAVDKLDWMAEVATNFIAHEELTERFAEYVRGREATKLQDRQVR
jgi:hypothetical protein